MHHDGGDAVEAVRLGVQRRVETDLHGYDLLAGPVAPQHSQPAGERRCARAPGTPMAWPARPVGSGCKSIVTRSSVTALPLPARCRVLLGPGRGAWLVECLVWRCRLVLQHRAVVGPQPRRRDGLHLRRGDVEDPADGRERELRVAEQTAYRHSSSARPATVPSRSSHSRSSRAWARSISSADGPSAPSRACSSSTAASISANPRRWPPSRPASRATGRRPAASRRSRPMIAVRSRRTSRLYSRDDMPEPRMVTRQSAASHSRVPSGGSR